MNSKNTTLVLAVAFAALGLLWFTTRDSQPKVGVKTLTVPKIAKDDVTKVTITIPGKEKKPEGAPAEGPVAVEREPTQTVVLEKDGASFVVYAENAPNKKHVVEPSQLDALLDAVAEFSPGDRIANDKAKLKELEIDDDQALRVAIATKGKDGLDLLFGRAAKSGGTTVRQANSNDVFVAKGRLGAVAKKDLAQWRKKSVVSKKADDFTAVEVVRADGATLTVTGSSEEVPPPEGAPADAKPTTKTTWTLTQPAARPSGFRLDEQALSRFASSLASLRAADFADGATDAVAGFAAPHTTVKGTLKDGGSVVLHLGTADDKKRVYAKLDGDAQVYLLAEYAAKGLDKGLDDLRDLTLFTAKLEDVERATFVAGKVRVVVAKDGEAWKVIEPKTPPPELDVAQIPSAVGAALRLRASRYEGAVADQGGSDPTIEVALRGGSKQTVRFGKVATEGGPDVLVRGADGAVYAIGAFQKGRYEKPVDLFKKPPAPPPGMGGGGISGLESLPPDVRKKLEASLKQQGLN